MKKIIILLTVLLLVVLALIFSPWKYLYAPSHSGISLPSGYTLKNYNIEKVLDVSCKKDSDCQTPGEYLIQSRCPFVSLCLKDKCNVVCPPQYKDN